MMAQEDEAARDMKAGPPLDALIHESVFDGVVVWTEADLPRGWVNEDRVYPAYLDGTFAFALRPYSTDLTAAWRVVEWLTKGNSVTLEYQLGVWTFEVNDGRNTAMGWGDTAPLAVCLAALAALGVDVPA
jgi:hypothetical protein